MSDDKDLAGLSEAERASLAEDEDLKDVEGLLEEEGEEEEGDETPEDSEEAEVEEGVTEEAAAEEAEEVEEDEPARPVQPVVQQQPDFAAMLADLDQKFEDGELSMAQYLSQRDALNEQRIALRMRSEIYEATREQNWQAANTKFFSEHPDYSAEKSRLRFVAMQVAVEDIAAENSGLSDLDLLLKAKEKVDAEFGIKKPEAKPEANKPLRVVSDRSKAPPSLRDIPAAAASDTGGGEFSHLEKLSGIDLEAAVARMSPEQQARWAEAG